MTQFKCIVINPAPPPQSEDYDDREKYYHDLESYHDAYWSAVIENPLIFLPKNTIIFWGFEVKLSKNEYDMLKSITDLNSSHYSNVGYTAEKILKNVDYRRNNLEKAKNITIQRTIITLKSSIKRKNSDRVVEVVQDIILFNKFNPYIEGKNKDKELKVGVKETTEELEKVREVLNDNDFRKKVLKSELNLVKIHFHLLNFLKCDDLPYSAFNVAKAVDSLIRPAKSQKHHSKHRYFQTDFSLDAPRRGEVKYLSPKMRKIKKAEKVGKFNFNYASIKRKYNLYNFVNDVVNNTDSRKKFWAKKLLISKKK
jgi:hypothetical protein